MLCVKREPIVAAMGKVSRVRDRHVGQGCFCKPSLQVHGSRCLPSLGPEPLHSGGERAVCDPRRLDREVARELSWPQAEPVVMVARYSSTNVAISELVAKKPSRPLGTGKFVKCCAVIREYTAQRGPLGGTDGRHAVISKRRQNFRCLPDVGICPPSAQQQGGGASRTRSSNSLQGCDRPGQATCSCLVEERGVCRCYERSHQSLLL